MLWLVLGLWWVAYPLLERPAIPLWYAHMLVVILVAIACLPRLWRTQRVRFGLPVTCTLLAVVSLIVSLTAEAGFPVMERWWAGVTGAGHAQFFLACLVLVPPRGDERDGRDAHGHELDPAAARFRIGLMILLGAMLLSQLAVVLRDIGDVPRAAGTLGNPNFLGAFVAATVLALGAFARWRLGVLLLLATLLFLVVTTRSRGAVASGGLVLLLFLARRSWKAVTVGGALMVLALVAIPNPLWERVAALRSEQHFSRPFIWNTALANIADHPLGIGPAMNKYVFPAQAFDPLHPWLLHQRHEVGLTHNVFLTIALEWGWLAGAAVLVLAIWAVLRVIAPRRRADALGQGAVLGSSVFVLSMQADGLEQNPVLFSLVLFLAATALHRLPRPSRGPAIFPGRAAAVLMGLAVLGLGGELMRRAVRTQPLRDASALFAVWEAEQSDLQDWRLSGEGPQPPTTVSEEDVRTAIAIAESVAPREPRPAALRAEFESGVLDDLGTEADAERLELLEQASRDALARARAGNPRDAELSAAAAALELRCYRRSARDPSRRRIYIAAMEVHLAVDPLDVNARWELAREVQRAGQAEVMERHLARMFSLEPDDARAWQLLAMERLVRGDREGALYAYVRAAEAVHNCRFKAAGGSVHARKYYERILGDVDLPSIRRRITILRRELYS